MRRVLWTVLLAPLLSCSAYGWGCDGHQIVALIARARLDPAVSAAVDDMLRSSPIDPALSRYCKDRPADLMADAATWADDARDHVKNAPWHFVDIPRSVTSRTALDAWCPPVKPSADGGDWQGCVVSAIEYELAVLRDKSATEPARAEALRYIIHLVGDIHQPLHDIDNHDEGGNCTVLQFQGLDTPTNLHSVWDSRIIRHVIETEKLSDSELAAALNLRFTAKYATLSAAQTDDPASWAWEGSEIARKLTYGALEPAIPIAAPDSQDIGCQAEKSKVEPLHIAIGDTYLARATPVVEEQLATAGFRLALLLNDTLRTR